MRCSHLVLFHWHLKISSPRVCWHDVVFILGSEQHEIKMDAFTKCAWKVSCSPFWSLSPEVSESLMTPWELTSPETKYEHVNTHRHTNSGWHIPGHHFNDWSKAVVSSCLWCHVLVCVFLWKTDVWSAFCVSVAGSRIAALSQFWGLWSDLRSARWEEHSHLLAAPVSQPWAITLLSLSSSTIKTEEE